MAQVGDWKLLEFNLSAGDLPAQGSYFNIQFNNNSSYDTYLDGVRVQPLYGEMMAYVYSPYDFKVLATFDDQHFGIFYQDNREGQLIRKFIETERGLKTLQETQYHSKAKPR